jgi:O-antigen/teichoic acid export membrane protein
VLGYLKRLLTTGAAYQFGDILAKGLALLTLPLYTHHLSPDAYGAAESLLTAVILASILLRVGLGEAFIRFYFDDDDQARRQRIARTVSAAVAWTTTLAALVAVALAGELSRLLLGFHDPLLIDCAVLGLWAFTNLEIAYAQLRVDERARTYVLASGANVAMTVAFTTTLVVFAHQGARGLLLGNFGASAVIVLALWWVLRARFSLRLPGGRAALSDLRAMLRFGLPTVPADASVYALQVADRFYLFRSYSHGAAGLYSVAIKLATVVFVAVRGFQYAWPPLAYSIESDEEAARLYSLVTTYYALATGVVVCAVALLGRWMVALLSAHRYFGAYRALPWLALGWDRRARTCHDAQLPRRRRRPRRQHRGAARARAWQWRRTGHCGRGHRALRRLRGDADRDVRTHAQPLQGRLRMAAPGAAQRDPRRRWRLRRAVAPNSRRGRASGARRLAGARARAAALDPLLSPPRARRREGPDRRRAPPRGGLSRRPWRARGLRRGPAAGPVRLERAPRIVLRGPEHTSAVARPDVDRAPRGSSWPQRGPMQEPHVRAARKHCACDGLQASGWSPRASPQG